MSLTAYWNKGCRTAPSAPSFEEGRRGERHRQSQSQTAGLKASRSRQDRGRDRIARHSSRAAGQDRDCARKRACPLGASRLDPDRPPWTDRQRKDHGRRRAQAARHSRPTNRGRCPLNKTQAQAPSSPSSPCSPQTAARGSGRLRAGSCRDSPALSWRGPVPAKMRGIFTRPAPAYRGEATWNGPTTRRSQRRQFTD